MIEMRKTRNILYGFLLAALAAVLMTFAARADQTVTLQVSPGENISKAFNKVSKESRSWPGMTTIVIPPGNYVVDQLRVWGNTTVSMQGVTLTNQDGAHSMLRLGAKGAVPVADVGDLQIDFFESRHLVLLLPADNRGRQGAVPTRPSPALIPVGADAHIRPRYRCAAGPMWAYFVTLRVRPLRSYLIMIAKNAKGSSLSLAMPWVWPPVQYSASPGPSR